MWMSLTQITDLKVHIGANGKYQSSVRLEAST